MTHRTAILLLTFLVSGAPLSGQGGRGTIRGRVVDASSDAPVPAAEVSLLARLLSDTVGGAVDLGAYADDPEALARRTVDRAATDARGAYRFQGVPAGRYLLHVRRLGYRSVTVGVAIGPSEGARVSLALDVDAIELPPLDVRTAGEARVVLPSGERVALGRLPAVRLRQERYLTSDARLLTDADVEESVTLGEPDVFRALQRLPGVTTRDDYSAELWTRGASWGETRVYLDDLPLFNPLHGFGLLSGVSPRTLGAATFHPGVKPTSHPEGGAAVVDLRSRSGRGMRSPEGGLDLSLASAQAWAMGPALDGRLGWSVAARRSYADAVAALVSDAPEDQLPYDFSDVQGRLDFALDGGWELALHGLWEEDRIRGEIPDVLQSTTGEWGNVVTSLTLSGPLGPVRLRQTVGATVYGVDVREVESDFDTTFNAPSEPPADHRARYLVLRGELAPRGAGEGGWRAGYDLVHQHARYTGPRPWPYSRRPPALPEVEREADLVRASLWGRHRWAPLDRLTLEGGLRVAAGSRTRRGSMELAPTLAARFHLTPAVRLSAAAGRTLQYAQSPAPLGPRVEGTLQTGRLWVLADEEEPYLDAEHATLGGEAWLGDAWLLSLTGYLRRTGGLLLPDPTPGALTDRPALVEGSGDARGVELSLRRLAGRVTGSASYSLGDADARAEGTAFPAPNDRTHAVDLMLRGRASGAVDLGLAYTYASGAPYTRVVDCADADPCTGVVLDRPFGRRAPAYSSLDLTVDVTHRFGGWSVAWYVQARNVLAHDNAVTYDHTTRSCAGGTTTSGGACLDGAAPVLLDRFVTGIPPLPLIGARLTFRGDR